MLVLLAAVAVAATPDARNIPPLPADAPAAISRMPNLYSQPPACTDQPDRVVDRYGRPVAAPLASLPQPSLQLLVDRKIAGCRVVTVARGSPPPAADQPNPPASQHRLQPLQPNR